jgi:hypothetical protein
MHARPSTPLGASKEESMAETEAIDRELRVRRALAVHELKLRRSRRRAGGYAVVTGQNRPVFPGADQRDATLDEVEVYAWRLAHPHQPGADGRFPDMRTV